MSRDLIVPWVPAGGGAPADAISIATRLADRPGLSVLCSAEPTAPLGRFSYVACDPVEAVVGVLDPEAGRAAKGSSSPAPRFIGIVPYEALRAARERPGWTPEKSRPRPALDRIEWLRFDAVVAIDHRDGSSVIVADDAAAASRLVDKLGAPAPLEAPFAATIHEPDDGRAHIERVRTAIERIYDGEFYQVNLARRIAIRFEPPNARALLAASRALLAASPTPFGAVMRTIGDAWVLSTTPELLLDAEPDAGGSRFLRIATEPIKGTRRRATDPAEDDSLARALESDPKERAELAMIIDVERNDLARVCDAGSVVVERMPHVVSHRTVHHRVARVTGRVRAGVSRADVLEALLPSGSVTGAPKVRAMETIAELEPMRRGLYTGGFGYIGRDGSTRLAMAIRTLVVDSDGNGEYLVGGGIVADSDPESELAETRWKAAQLAALLGPRVSV